MAFTADQRRALTAKLDRRAIRERVQNGHTVSYLEGWYALSQANRIFGFDGWDRETLNLRCVWEGTREGRVSCAYLAHVRVRVRAAETVICRDGHGLGVGSGKAPGEAHESAAKEAETDATKRALVTFGNAFGLCLYDKAQSGVRRSRKPNVRVQLLQWVVRPLQGEPMTSADPVEFCSALRNLLTQCITREEVSELWLLNADMLSSLSEKVPALRTEKGQHYADLLTALYRKQLAAFTSKQTSIDKFRLIISEPRRVRDKDHLRAVAKQPCLVCGRAPSHAHHLRFAQPRALSRKPSDEYVVPLCRLHHRAVHETGDEKVWWADHKVDPLPEAERLWVQNHNQKNS